MSRRPPSPTQWTRRRSAALRTANEGARYRAQVGALGDALHRAGLTVAAVGGPGAVLGAMTRDGAVDARASAPTAMPTGADVVLVELPELYEAGRADPAEVQRALGAIDREVAAVLQELPEGAALLLAGTSDGPTGGPHLHVAMAAGPSFGPGLLTSASTGRDGVVQLIDVAPAVLRLTGAAAPPAMLGAAWHEVAGAAVRRASGWPPSSTWTSAREPSRRPWGGTTRWPRGRPCSSSPSRRSRGPPGGPACCDRSARSSPPCRSPVTWRSSSLGGAPAPGRWRP